MSGFGDAGAIGAMLCRMTRGLRGTIAVVVLVLVVAVLAWAPAGSGPARAGVAEAAGAVAPAGVTRMAATAAVSGVGPFTITAPDLGIHANHTKPKAPTGALRLNCYPTWREINPAKGVYRWAKMDALVNRAVAWGYSDIVHSFCGTPKWAAGPVKTPKYEALGYKSTAAPKNMADWEAYITEVVKRYKGRITAYQAWNEGTAKSFFQGTPSQLGTMTSLLNKVVSTHDPNALVLSASVQQVNSAQRSWGLSYLKQLKSRGWPVEVLTFHGYGPRNTVANGRQAAITSFRRQLASLRAPRLPIWDTETTYTGTAIKGEKAGALVVRSYLDGWRMGVKRTYWYIWFDGYNKFGSIQMRSGSAPALALKRFGDRVIGATYLGCTEASNGLVRCRFTKDGQPFTIMWAEGSSVVVPQAAATSYQNLATGSWSSATRITVKGSPLLIGARP